MSLSVADLLAETGVSRRTLELRFRAETGTTPGRAISEAKLAATHPDAFDGYCEWYPLSREVKLTKTDLARYLKLSGHTNPEQVIADCTEPGNGPKTYTLTKLKEGSE